MYAYCGGDPVNRLDPMGLDSWLIGSLLRGAGLEEAGEWADNTVDGAAEAGSYWSEADSIAEVAQDAADHEAIQEVHGALQTAQEVAAHVPIAGDLAGHAVNIVDKMVGVWGEHVNGVQGGVSAGPGGGGSISSPAWDELFEAIFDGVADRSKGRKPDAGAKSAVGEGQKRPHGNKVDGRPAELYKKYNPDTGELKMGGFSKDAERRYTKKQLGGDQFEVIDRGPRDEMLKKERELVKTRPGPESREPWRGTRQGDEPQCAPPS